MGQTGRAARVLAAIVALLTTSVALVVVGATPASAATTTRAYVSNAGRTILLLRLRTPAPIRRRRDGIPPPRCSGSPPHRRPPGQSTWRTAPNLGPAQRATGAASLAWSLSGRSGNSWSSTHRLQSVINSSSNDWGCTGVSVARSGDGFANLSGREAQQPMPARCQRAARASSRCQSVRPVTPLQGRGADDQWPDHHDHEVISRHSKMIRRAASSGPLRGRPAHTAPCPKGSLKPARP